MTLALLPEQEELARSVARFFTDAVTSEYLKKRLSSGIRHDPAFTAKLGELGLFEYFAEAGSLTDLSLVALESGRALVPEPIVEQLFSGPYLERRFSLKRAPSIKLGTELAAISPLKSEIAVVWHVSSFQVSGILDHVQCAPTTTGVVFIAPHNGVEKVWFAKIPASALAPTTSLDLQMSAHRITLRETPCTLLEEVCEENLQAAFRVLKASELSGLAARAVSMTKEYVQTRKQFGVPVGSFQAVQHQLAEAYLKSEAMRALAHFASWAVEHSPGQAELSSRAALTYAAEHAPNVVETAIQLHGGIGFTWEYDLHLYLRRARTIESLYGPTEKEYEKLLEAAGGIG